MCDQHLEGPHEQLVRFIDNKDGTTSILIDSDEFGTVISASVFTTELRRRYRAQHELDLFPYVIHTVDDGTIRVRSEKDYPGYRAHFEPRQGYEQDEAYYSTRAAASGY